MTSRTFALTVACILATAFAAPAGAAPVDSKNMGAYCRGQAAKAFSARPAYVKSVRPIKAADGSSSVDGTYENSDGKTKNFKCRYDAQGNFLDVKAAGK